MNQLVSKVEQTIVENALLEKDEKLLVAVSGGIDSMVLLDILYQLHDKYGWQLIIAHFNHKLRGEESDMDEIFVKEHAIKLGLDFISGQGDVKRKASSERISVEMAARKLRHSFLANCALSLNIKKIALAHHSDDQLETFFLRLIRGSGGEGLTGMRYITPSPANKQIILVRPLLDIRRKEIEKYAVEKGIQWREDKTNKELTPLRNRIRHQLIPLLEQSFQPAIHKVIRRLTELIGSESDFVELMAQNHLNNPINLFDSLHIAVQRRVIYEQLLKLTPEPTYDIVEELRQHPKQVIMIKSGLRVWRDEKGIIHSATKEPLRFLPDVAYVMLNSENGLVRFGHLIIRWKIRIIERLRSIPPHRDRKEWFDVDKIGEQIILRYWQPGDKIQLIGTPTEIKLQDLFTNIKIPPPIRRELVIATRKDGKLFWVEGLRIGEIAKLSETTRRILIWEWECVEKDQSLNSIFTTSFPKS